MLGSQCHYGGEGTLSRRQLQWRTTHDLGFTLSYEIPVTFYLNYKSVFRLKIYYASKRAVLHDLESAWAVQRLDIL